MIAPARRKGFEAVEFDNLDSWTRFDGTPLAGHVPFGSARRSPTPRSRRRAHQLGLAAAQKNTVELTRRGAPAIGFDFAIAEECGRYGECEAYRRLYGDRVIVIEYRRQDFDAACQGVGARVSVVLRDRDVTRPGSGSYVLGGASDRHADAPTTPLSGCGWLPTIRPSGRPRRGSPAAARSPPRRRTSRRRPAARRS